MVRIFEREKATPFGFYVQLKSTDNLSRYLVENETTISFPVSTDHADHWLRFWEPVVLVIYDAASEKAYWGIVQDLFEVPSGVNKRRNLVHMKISTTNFLNREGLERIRRRTVRRFKRFEEQGKGAKVLVEAIREAWGVKIKVDLHGGLIQLPEGKFVPSKSGGANMVFFGRLAVIMRNICKQKGLSPHDLLLKSAEAVLSADREGRLEQHLVKRTPEEYQRLIESLEDM